MHIIYICSPDRDISLLISLGSLLTSGTEFDKLTIYCIGKLPMSWMFEDKRVRVEEKPNLSRSLWMENKTYLSNIEGETVIFIDVDTFIFRPLNIICENLTVDVAGRLTSSSQQMAWDQVIWKGYLNRYGAKRFFPYLNTGFLIFRNCSHKLLDPIWLNITRDLVALKFYPFGKLHKANQVAFSLACGSLNLSYHLLPKNQHAYGWEKERFQESFVFHTGNKRFVSYISEIDARTNLLRKNPLISYQEIQKFLNLNSSNS